MKKECKKQFLSMPYYVCYKCYFSLLASLEKSEKVTSIFEKRITRLGLKIHRSGHVDFKCSLTRKHRKVSSCWRRTGRLPIQSSNTYTRTRVYVYAYTSCICIEEVAQSRFSSWYHLYLPRPRPGGLSHLGVSLTSFAAPLSSRIVYMIFISRRLPSDFIFGYHVYF